VKTKLMNVKNFQLFSQAYCQGILLHLHIIGFALTNSHPLCLGLAKTLHDNQSLFYFGFNILDIILIAIQQFSS
jgi:hypothetical protein